jgi:CHAT domain-containing protein
MYEDLYPKAEYPRGHPDLACSLRYLGAVFYAQGEYARALPYHEKALAMCEALYPPAEYPRGHPDLAQSLSALGWSCWGQGEYARALAYHERALAMWVALCPKAKYPNGHHRLALSLRNLGAILRAQGEYARALTYSEKALAMYEDLYPKAKYPNGHPRLTRSLNSLGAILRAQGEYARALRYFEKALAMCEALYPPAEYPQGHPDLAQSLNDLGGVLQARGEYAQALTYYTKALAMQEGLADLFIDATSEAEALNYLARLPRYRDSVLSFPPDKVRTPDDDVYAPVWRGKGTLTRVLERRRQRLQAATDPQCRALWESLQATRRQLARLMLAAPADPKAHEERLLRLNADKERLERELARHLPAGALRQPREPASPKELLQRLPARSVFIDLFRYNRVVQDPKKPGDAGLRRTPSYVAFVLCPRQPIRRVELGPAKPIEEALLDWRQAIEDDKAGGPAAPLLRRRVWEPLARHVPADTETVYLAPDAALTRLPWDALPGRRADTVLLEDHNLILAPHGPFLLRRLTDSRNPDPKGSLLAVGLVSYDRPPEPFEMAKDSGPLMRPALRSRKGPKWLPLPATREEIRIILDLAGKRPTRHLTGSQASTARLLAELPRARWAHLATHGFFADKSFRSVLQVNERLFAHQEFAPRATPGARNPLVLSGLVLAGANRPAPTGLNDLLRHDGGILTAEAVAGLPLDNLELAVLSACETGLGDVAGGEGVFGLQRAFHLAGTRNVIASLWKVDDKATAALMGLFYYKLWKEDKEPRVALREAQLTLYRHPELVHQLAGERGINFDKVVPLPADAPMAPKPGKAAGKAPVKLWAGFVLSGPGR